MEDITKNMEQLVLAESQARAAEFTARIDRIFEALPDSKQAGWDLRFPAKDGHAGLGLLGNPGYEDQPGRLEIQSIGDGYIVSLRTTNDQKLGRPHSMQSTDDQLEIMDSLYDGLQVVLRPKSDQPITLNGFIGGWEPREFHGVPLKDTRFLADICILQGERKVGIKPKPVHQLVGAVGIATSRASTDL